MTSLVLALTLTAWPLAPDAGRDEYALAANWPNDPDWLEHWPLLSFAPAGWARLDGAERDAGVGMAIDCAWSFTRGTPETIIAVVGSAHDLSDPIVAQAFALNAGELPDGGAVDRTGDGRVDVRDLALDPRVSDRNGNGAVDLADVRAAFDDGVDDDGNGRVDDLCGWDFTRGAPISSSADAGVATFRALVAPVNDGQPGVGVCPGCTIIPVVADTQSLPRALEALAPLGVDVVLLPFLPEAPRPLLAAIARRRMIIVASAPATSPTLLAPLVLAPDVLSARALSTDTPLVTNATTATAHCAANVAGRAWLPTATCEPTEAATTLAGVAGLLRSLAPTIEARALEGLLGGDRVDVGRAAALLATGAPTGVVSLPSAFPRAPFVMGDAGTGELTWSASMSPRAADFATSAPAARIGALETDPFATAGTARFVTSTQEWRWPYFIELANDGAPRLSVTRTGDATSAAPRYVDLELSGADDLLVPTGDGLEDQLTGWRVGGLSGLAPAVGDLDGDGRPELVTLSDRGALRAATPDGGVIFAAELGEAPAGAPVLARSELSNFVVTLTRSGLVTMRSASATASFATDAGQDATPAAADLDGDKNADVVVANGAQLWALHAGSASLELLWSRPTRAHHVVLGQLSGDARAEIVADRVLRPDGELLLELDGWQSPVSPPALADLDGDGRRELVQLEAAGSGSWEVARYDVGRAIAGGDSFVTRAVVRTLRDEPSPGGFLLADVTGDRRVDFVVPTVGGLVFVFDASGASAAGSPWLAFGSVLAAPAIGVSNQQLVVTVRTTQGELVTWLASGSPVDIAWEGFHHDAANTGCADTKLPERRLGGLGITQPPVLAPKGCGCASRPALLPLALLAFLARRARRR